MSGTSWRPRWASVFRDNPVTVQALGLCSALAVTTSLDIAITMSLAVTAVLLLSSASISLIRHWLPGHVRLILEITIISSMVIVADQVLQAYWFELSQRLSIFVSLIVTNCLVLARVEAFASHNGLRASLWDAWLNGLGYSLALILIGGVRELLGTGRLLGKTVLVPAADGGWFQPLELMLLAPSAFFLLGALVWAARSFAPEQAEEPDTESCDDDAGMQHD